MSKYVVSILIAAVLGAVVAVGVLYGLSRDKGGKTDVILAIDDIKEIAQLAKCPNVVAKLGGLNMDINGFHWHEQPKPPTSQALIDATRPFFEYTIEKFGADRCMFESNFPVDKLSCSYVVCWNSFKRLTKDYSKSEKAKLYHDTAVRVYRL